MKNEIIVKGIADEPIIPDIDNLDVLNSNLQMCFALEQNEYIKSFIQAYSDDLENTFGANYGLKEAKVIAVVTEDYHGALEAALHIRGTDNNGDSVSRNLLTTNLENRNLYIYLDEYCEDNFGQSLAETYKEHIADGLRKSIDVKEIRANEVGSAVLANINIKDDSVKFLYVADIMGDHVENLVDEMIHNEAPYEDIQRVEAAYNELSAEAENGHEIPIDELFAENGFDIELSVCVASHSQTTEIAYVSISMDVIDKNAKDKNFDLFAQMGNRLLPTEGVAFAKVLDDYCRSELGLTLKDCMKPKNIGENGQIKSKKPEKQRDRSDIERD